MRRSHPAKLSSLMGQCLIVRGLIVLGLIVLGTSACSTRQKTGQAMAVVGAAGVVAASGAVPIPELAANGAVRLNSRRCAANNCGGSGFKSTSSKVVAGAGVALAVVGSALQDSSGGPDKARLRSHRVPRSTTNPWRLQRADADEPTPAEENQTAPVTEEQVAEKPLAEPSDAIDENTSATQTTRPTE